MSSNTKNPHDFETSIDQLNSIIQQLETETPPIDIALKQFESGVKLIKQCKDILTNAEQQVKILTDSHLEPFKNND